MSKNYYEFLTICFPPLYLVAIFQFYKYCDKWQKQVKKNPDTYKEYNLFGVSREMNETLEFVSKRLGLINVLSLGLYDNTCSAVHATTCLFCCTVTLSSHTFICLLLYCIFLFLFSILYRLYP